jgi:NhaP-type Na+/H+ or K+/H+ antiporter
MRLIEEHKTAFTILVVGFVVWLLFHFATKQTAAAATAAAVSPLQPPLIQATMTYP